LNEIQKTQFIRVLDIILIGPMMIYASTKIPKDEYALKIALIVTGAYTSIYNLNNFIENLKHQ
jgi:hypothetical protein